MQTKLVNHNGIEWKKEENSKFRRKIKLIEFYFDFKHKNKIDLVKIKFCTIWNKINN